MLDYVTDKVQDESRQGEAFAPFAEDSNQYKKLFYIESYGCQMNFSDSEIVASILMEHKFAPTRDLEAADLIPCLPGAVRSAAKNRKLRSARIHRLPP